MDADRASQLDRRLAGRGRPGPVARDPSVHRTPCGTWLPLLAALALAGCQDAAPPAAEQDAARFAGTEACRDCHAAAFEAWHGSHHDLAMQEATPRTVLGDVARFPGDATGDPGTLVELDGRVALRAPGPDGQIREHRIAYSFGVEPLQQYLVELDRGRLQALTIAWDSRPADAGGQRWFSLYPGDPAPSGDALHWTAPALRWNRSCAHCHSTGVKRGYDSDADAYTTSWAEIDVACEACHGPGSRHVAWAERGAPRAGHDERGVRLGQDGARWVMDPGKVTARREPPRRTHDELETCAPCHSRRSLLTEDPDAHAYLDAHQPVLLEQGLYHADGQILDEVYVYGSFLQSRMHRAGVSCGDCHEPHSLELRAANRPVCAGCHAPEHFATRTHHHHVPGSEAARCVSCHMPARTYMGVDVRRDHGFRVPRPDLAAALGTPDVCSGCHTERDAAWAARELAGWPGTRRRGAPHFASALAAARGGEPGAHALLLATLHDLDQPAIARATALVELARTPPGPPAHVLEEARAAAEPLLRMAAARAGETLAPGPRARLLAGLLSDPLRAVRLEAARALADVPAALLDDGGVALERALAEYRAAQRLNADDPAARVNLGVLHLRRGELEAARVELERALELGPWLAPASIELAEVHRLAGREVEAERVLRRGLDRAPRSAPLLHALGLSLVRQGRHDAALEPLRRAADADPGSSRLAYVYGVALHETGQTGRGLEVLEAARRRHPADRAILEALVTISVAARRPGRALTLARELERAAPDDPRARRLRERIESLVRDSRADGALPD